VCRVCCGPAAGLERVCFACRRVGHLLGAPLTPVFPVRLCPLPGPLYTVLRGYKEASVAEARRRFGAQVRALLDAFLAAHGPCLAATAAGPLGLALPVPSSARPGRAPLDGVTGLADAVAARLGTRWVPDALVRAGAPVGHMRPHRQAYAVPAAAQRLVVGQRAVLVDDTYVSGARAQSAAAALRRAGAAAVVSVVLGRVLRPDRVDLHARFLRHLQAAAPAPDAREPAPRPCGRCVCAQTGLSTA